MKTLYSKKYGVDLPRFTHKSSTIIHASTKEDDTIRYHSLHDNKYLQYFRGHKGKVISLEVSPVDDGFISGSNDKTVRLWDLRTPGCRGLLSLPSPPVVAYDPSGIIFAVAVNPYARILLYDQANFDKAPFLTIHVNDPGLMFMTFPPRQIYITSLSFSPDAKLILVGCSGAGHYVLDAFKGSVLAKLEGHVGLERKSMNMPQTIETTKGISGEEVSWTPDCKYVVGGSLDGRVFVWDIQNLPQLNEAERAAKVVPRVQPISSLDGHPGPSRCVRFNPRFAMMCVAGTELVRNILSPSEKHTKDFSGLLASGYFPRR
jgi:COMPASS component SWD2